MTFSRVGHTQSKKGLLFPANTLTERSSCLSFIPLSNKSLHFFERGDHAQGKKATQFNLFFKQRSNSDLYY